MASLDAYANILLFSFLREKKLDAFKISERIGIMDKLPP